MSRRIGLMSGPLIGGLALLAATLALPGVAEARSSVSFGIGIGPVPLYPHYRHHHHHHYPPVYVAPPPPVIYQPAPSVVFNEAPITVNPAGPAYRARNGQLCREYQTTLMIGGVPQPGFGTACQQPDGSWRIVN